MASYDVNPVPKAQTKVANFCRFLCNPEDGTCMNRTPKSWGKITGFYLVYYALLAGFFAAMIMAFFTTIEDHQPKLQDWDSLIKYNPGMGYRPQPEVEFTLIEFHVGDLESYEKYTESMDKFLEDYSEDAQQDLVKCDSDNPAYDHLDPSKSCKYPLGLLGLECTSEKHYGYDEGRPCVILKLNKMFNWRPEPIPNTTALNPDLVGRYDPNYIGVTCDGVNDADRDNIGPVKFWPDLGFDVSYFPYHKQDGYLQPIVMAQFDKLTPGTLVQVWCKAWAGNIYHDRNDRAGSVNFEMLRD